MESPDSHETSLDRKEFLPVLPRDALGHLARQLAQPLPVAGHDLGITFPSLVHPGVGTEEEACRMAGEKRLPSRGEMSLLGDIHSIRKLSPHRRIPRQQLLDPG